MSPLDEIVQTHDVLGLEQQWSVNHRPSEGEGPSSLPGIRLILPHELRSPVHLFTSRAECLLDDGDLRRVDALLAIEAPCLA